MKRITSLLLTLAMLLGLLSGLALNASATVGDPEYNTGAERNHYTETISQNGSITLEVGADYVLTVEAGVKTIEIIGNGAEFDAETGKMTSTPNEVLIDASAAPGITIRLQDVYFSNNFNRKNTINFSGEGNTLVFGGTNVIDTDNNAYGYAAIHVNQQTELTLYGETDSRLYFYKREQGAGIGGNSQELNGKINFGLVGGANDFYFFMKGTKQGALIGAGSGSGRIASDPGPVSFNSGIYNLETNSRGACVGGSAGGVASKGTNVYVRGASLNINMDYTGACIGGGGYSGGNDASGGNLYVESGSVRTVIDENSAAASTGYGGKEYTAGVNDAGIHAARWTIQSAGLENIEEKTPVYWCIVDTSAFGVKDTSYVDVEVDGNIFYSGPLHNYCFVQETLDKANQYSIASTPSNWVPNDEPNLYLFLTGENHEISINGSDAVTYVWNAENSTFAPQAGETTYAVSFGGVTQDMTVEVFNAADESVGTGSQYRLENGTYTYTVKRGDETIKTGSFTVADAELNVPILFTVKLDVTPSDAAVEVGGYEGQSGYVVKTPNEDGSYSLQAGTGYVLKITAEHYKSLETEFDVTGDATLRYTLTADHTFADNGFCTVCNVYNPDAEGYTVSTQEQLAAIAAAVNGGDTLAGKTVALANDLTLNGAWTPIGGETTAVSLTLGSQEDLDAALKEHAIIYDNTGASYVPNSDKNGSYDENRTYYYLNGAAFGGVFDGGKHEISGLNVDTDAGYAGLFGNVSGTVKNLTVRGSVKTAASKDFVGGIVGKLSAGGVISDCISYVNVDAPKAYNVGGIVGMVGEVAQFVSETNPMAAVVNCANYGEVKGYVRTGGIAGRNAGTVTYCANHGTIFNYSGQKKGTGGIVGMNGSNNTPVDAGIVTFCYNDGYVNGNKGYWTGGIVGFQNAKSTVANCYNAGTLYTSASATGSLYSWVNPIVGQNEGAVTDCLWLNKDSGDNTANFVGRDPTGVGNAGGTVTGVEGKTEDELKGSAAVAALNTESDAAFKVGCSRFPLLAWETDAAHTLTATAAAAATCTADGNIAYWTCSVCNMLFSDEGGTVETTLEKTVIPAAHTALTHVTAKAAACKQDGNIEYWHCTDCGKYYSDEALTTEITEKDTVLRGLPHSWSEATYVWTETADGYTCTGTTHCTREGCTAEPMTETVTAVYAITADATCTEAGAGVYTAEFANNKIAKTTKTVVIEAKGHTEVVDAAVEATCTAAGKTEGKHCSVCNEVLTAQQEIPAKGHTFANGTCTVCGAKDPDWTEPETPWVNPFKDVVEGKWYYEGVKFANRNELFNGTATDTFSPNDPMTRAMLVTVLWRLDGKPSADKLSTPFVDVPVTDGKNVYYAEAVAWAAENGIVNGVDTTHFAPDDEVTREQIAAILFRYAEKKGVDTTKRADLSSFPDAKAVSAYAENAVAWAVASGLVNGIKDGANALLAPQSNATRAQVAVILMRYAS